MFLYVIIYEISFIWRFLLLDKLKKQLDFLIKIDEAKEIFRHTKLFSGKNDKNVPPTSKPDDQPDHRPHDAPGSDESAEKWRK